MSLLDNMFQEAKASEELEFNENESINAESSDQEILDWMLSSICGALDVTRLAFKGGYTLSKLLPKNVSRATTDIDFSISDIEYYSKVIDAMRSMADSLVSLGVINSYEVKDNIGERMSGGIKLHRDSREVKDLGIDVGLHDLSYGITTVKLGDNTVSAFMVERMLTDKISAIYSRKRFRRSKDLYDFYVITNYFDVDLKTLNEFIIKRDTVEWDKTPFNEVVMVQYKKAYDKLNINSYIDYDGVDTRPRFEEIMSRLSLVVSNLDSNLKWSCKDRRLI